METARNNTLGFYAKGSGSGTRAVVTWCDSTGGNGGWQDPYEYNARYAVLGAGEPYLKGDPMQPDDDIDKTFRLDLEETYKILTTKYGFSSNNIFSIYRPETENKIKNGIKYYGECWDDSGYGFSNVMETYLRDKITANDLLYIQLHSHGSGVQVCMMGTDILDSMLDGRAYSVTKVDGGTPTIYNIGSKTPIKSARTVICLCCCESRGLIHNLMDGTHTNRIIMSNANFPPQSSHADNQDSTHDSFLWRGITILQMGIFGQYPQTPTYGYLPALNNYPTSIFMAFKAGYYAALNNYNYKVTGEKDLWWNEAHLEDCSKDGDVNGQQYPSLDSTNPAKDGYLAANTFL